MYKAGCKKVDNKAFIHIDLYNEAMKLNGKLKIGDKLKYRFRNLSEGIATGSYKFIENIQIEQERKFIRPRKILEKEDNDKLYSTRFLKPI